jgi:hypothetical protein
MQLGTKYQNIGWERREFIRGHSQEWILRNPEITQWECLCKNTFSGGKKLRRLNHPNGFFRKKRLLDILQDGEVSLWQTYISW